MFYITSHGPNDEEKGSDHESIETENGGQELETDEL